MSGTQSRTFDYKQEITSVGFNKILYKLMSNGIVSGGEIDRVDNINVDINPFVSLIEDENKEIAVRLDSNTKNRVEVSVSKPYIVGRFAWASMENNVMRFTSASENEILDTDIIFGKCIYKSSQLITFDYTQKSWARIHYEQLQNEPNFIVHVSEVENKILVGKGSAWINGKNIKFSSVQESQEIDMNVENSRIDLVVINDNGSIEIIKGEDASLPITPRIPYGSLAIAKITIPYGETILNGSMVEYIYNNHYQSSLGFSIITINESKTITNLYCDNRIILNNENITLTLGTANIGTELTIMSVVENNIVSYNDDSQMTIPIDSPIKFIYNGEKWLEGTVLSANVVGTCDTEGNEEEKDIYLTDYFDIVLPKEMTVHFTNANTFGDTTTTVPTHPICNIYNSNNVLLATLNICDSLGHFAGKGCWDNGDDIDFKVSGNKIRIINSDIRQKDTNYIIKSNNSIIQTALSETETPTGKYYIDGKPIYSRVINCDLTGYPDVWRFISNNLYPEIDTITDGCLVGNNGTTRSYFRSQILIGISSDKIQVFVTATSWTVGDKLIIEYTKK